MSAAAALEYGYSATVLDPPPRPTTHRDSTTLVVADHLLAGAYAALHRALVRGGTKHLVGVRLPRRAREPLSLLVEVDTDTGPRRYKVTVSEVRS